MTEHLGILVKLCLANALDGRIIHEDKQYCKWIKESVEKCPYIDLGLKEEKHIYGIIYGCKR